MADFMRSGGYGMWVVVLFGGICLVVAGVHAWRPTDRRVAIARALSVATVFAVLNGLTSNLAAVFYNVARNDYGDELTLVVFQGLGESLAVPILGFSMLGVAWLLLAVGVRRAE